MFGSVTKWWGSGEDKIKTEKCDQVEEIEDGKSDNQNIDKKEIIEDGVDTDIQEPKKDQFDEAAEKALNTAKQWGSYLLNVGKKATKTVTSTVSETAKQLKQTVEEKSILGDFSKEQDKFVNENKEKSQKSEASVPPWIGYNEEEAMKSQILALSGDKRNFLRNPPSGVQFHFDYDSSFPVAMVMLKEDESLNQMRFELVPKQIKEEQFWRNYFYRVSLIKQSAQLKSLAQQTGSETKPTGDVSSNSSGSTSKGDSDFDKLSDVQEVIQESGGKDQGTVMHKTHTRQEESSALDSTPQDNEFVSDAFQEESMMNDEDLRKEMQQLGMNENKDKENTEVTEEEEDNIADWEKELQAELNEYEVVDDGTVDVNDDDLEKEILQQIEAEAKQT